MSKNKKNKKNKKIENDETLGIDLELEDKQYLTDLELSRITLNAEKHEVFKKISEIYELKALVLSLRKQLHECQASNFEKDLLLLGQAKLKHKEEYNNFKQQSKEDLEEIGKAHGITVGKKFGYDPESKEIIL